MEVCFHGRGNLCLLCHAPWIVVVFDCKAKGTGNLSLIRFSDKEDVLVTYCHTSAMYRIAPKPPAA